MVVGDLYPGLTPRPPKLITSAASRRRDGARCGGRWADGFEGLMGLMGLMGRIGLIGLMREKPELALRALACRVPCNPTCRVTPHPLRFAKGSLPAPPCGRREGASNESFGRGGRGWKSN